MSQEYAAANMVSDYYNAGMAKERELLLKMH